MSKYSIQNKRSNARVYYGFSSTTFKNQDNGVRQFITATHQNRTWLKRVAKRYRKNPQNVTAKIEAIKCIQ